ncbi:FAD-dependent oxidoreductase [Chloroflexi bacterium TSY]|nr:FAD-dependent oxidoreductase [Chloroflexi bacterium TSY]
MNRRQLLQYSAIAAAGFAGIWMARRWLSREDALTYEELISQLDLACKPGTGSVIIIGSGFAGLAAASTLHDLGYTVTVLEARNRVGGRAYTRHDLGFPIDVGASWIHGVDGNPVTHLVEQYDFTLTPPTDYTSIALYDLDGRYINRLRLLRPLWQFESQMSSVEEAVAALEVDQSLYDVLSDLDLLSGFDGQRRRVLNYMYYGSYQQASSTEPKMMSAYGVLDGDSEEGEELRIAEGDEHWIVEGVGSVAEMLATGLDIRLSHVVGGVDYSDPEKVVVYTSEAEFVADRCIVTVPLGVLQKGSITFTPTLPQKLQNSIEKLIMGAFLS